MGIFSILDRDEDSEIINETERILRNHYSAGANEVLTKYLYFKGNPRSRVVEPFVLYASAIKALILESGVFPERYMEYLTYIENVYNAMFPYKEHTPDFENLSTIFLEMIHKDGIIAKKRFNTAMYDLFSDKFNYMKWNKNLLDTAIDGTVNSFIQQYAIEARAYFIDEDCFVSNLIDVTKKIQTSGDMQAVLDEETEKLHRMAGIYDVNEAVLLDAVNKIKMANTMHEKVVELVKIVDERVNILDSMSSNAINNVKSLCDDEVSKAKYELSIINEKLQQAYDSCVNEQKRAILYDKKKMVDEVFQEAEEKLMSLKRAAEKTVNTVKLEMPEGITKMELGGSDSNAEIKVSAPIPGGQIIAGGNSGATNAAGLVSYDEYAKIYETQTIIKDDDVEIPAINPLLDDSISFSERFEKAMEKKTYMIATGEHFHKMFDDVLIAVMENSNPYLIGPSGCGKTYMVSQIATILDMDFIDIGYINEEYDILGFRTANGGYSRPNFYRCYKYGKIAFCDELDNGNSRATVKLNSFLSNLKNASYNFPNGECVMRHPNFRMIGAGNTDGNGADSNYNSREKIEESVQQRLTPIYIGYDNEVEKKILSNYPDWYSFIVLFRSATDEWGKKNYGDAPGIITTRDATRIKRYKDNNSFDMSRILEYEFIQTKDITYLAFIKEHIRNRIEQNLNAKAIFDEFSKMIDSRRG
ncbi:AAA family ATPase [Eubacterium sp.]|uniref:AAA family ATPase n=1 Tax=Eubacterium sp. TaxID=142586 RepID=UPI0025874959|nr:AAA family ATPase [Eubacterium sp.]MCR5368190.1 AAA family ATPase [Eubacterium sp.]